MENGAVIAAKDKKSYPARCRRATHTAADIGDAGVAVVCLHGRIAEFDGKQGKLYDHCGVVNFTLASEAPNVGAGDIVEVVGYNTGFGLRVAEINRLVPVEQVPWMGGKWTDYRCGKKKQKHNLVLRAEVIKKIRTFFECKDFIEIDTPTLVRAAGQDKHIQLFETVFATRHDRVPYLLITSPEHHMKCLLGDGWDRIYQICRCFRNGERAEMHNPEFTMVEWYRSYADYRDIMEDTEALVAHTVLEVTGDMKVKYGGISIDLTPPWKRLGLRQAFAEFAGLCIDEWADEEAFVRGAHKLNIPSISSRDTWEDIFYKLLVEKIEPALVPMGPVFLLDYPAKMAALAKLKEGESGVAERVELYIGGVELANGFTELNDPLEQRRRFLEEQEGRRKANYPVHPLDEEFLCALERGMPPAAGIALGVDRLVMLLAGAKTLGEVMAFPFAEA